MKILVDTSVIVELDRKSQEVIKILKRIIEDEHELFISIITFTEILTGAYLRKDVKPSVLEAKRILGQFIWIQFNIEIAEKTSQYLAYLLVKGNKIEFQDVCIAATFHVNHIDYILTLNKSHFEILPDLKGKVYAPKEFEKIL